VRDALRGVAPLPVTAGEALLVMDILEAGQASAAERREIAL
jgi:predicted dehydrogenase